MHFSATVIPFASLALGAAIHERGSGFEYHDIPGYTFPRGLKFDNISEVVDQLEPAFDRNPREQIPTPIESLEKRDDIETSVGLGDTKTDYGCDQPIEDILRWAVEALCSNEHCDEGRDYTVDVWTSNEHMDNRETATLKVTVSGHYYGDVRHRLIEALQGTVTDDTAEYYDYKYSWSYGRDNFMGQCTMSSFPNFISLIRRVNSTVRDELKINVEKLDHTDDGWCAAQPWVETVVSNINGIAGAFFGDVTADCA